MEDTRPTFDDICYEYDKTIESLQAENKRLEGEVSDLIAGHIKIELHQKEIHAIEQKELHDRAETAEGKLDLTREAIKRVTDDLTDEPMTSWAENTVVYLKWVLGKTRGF